MRIAIPYGLCRLTPKQRPLEAGSYSYQMTCTHPLHINCNKTLSHGVSGSEESTIQWLKAWVVYGYDCTWVLS